ncbi:MAG: LodA/GoxA family CTQ-dependent oxidase, partial [Chitinophagales bacterium]
TFSELQGNLEFGSDNSYANQHIPINNPDTTDGDERQALIIDPGPRSLDSSTNVRKIEFSRYNIPEHYKKGSFPSIDEGGQQIDTLGELRMDDDGNLIALGGYGNVTGSADITSFRGAAGYWDDIADGYVICTITINGDSTDTEPAWLLVGSPKFAPELVNITTLHDTMYDIGIRKMSADSDIYDDSYGDACPMIGSSGTPLSNRYTPLKGFNPNYPVNYDSQIKPIIDRMKSYRWVADIPYLTDFANPGFDLKSATDDERMGYFNLFRVPLLPEDYETYATATRSRTNLEFYKNNPNQLFSTDGIPLMPLNSGDNSVTNTGPIYKFETLSVTQYFFLYQWATGNFNTNPAPVPSTEQQLDEAGIGNCVGAPFSPGIETTWMTRNRPIYRNPGELKLANYDYGSNHANERIVGHYEDHGLSIQDVNETEGEGGDQTQEGNGCEPGDLTKRMAIPWQADFQECTVQTPNISNPNVNQFADGTGIEVPPAYYVYWWPPQSPMHVVSGSVKPHEQVLDAIVSQIDGQPIIPAGQRVPYQRGINSIEDMINSWSRLGFIVNQSRNESYPYFVEKERNFGQLGQLAAMQQAAAIANAKAK